MAMNVGGGGSDKEPEVMLDINTTPLIDVMLVLLVMLIITIPIQLHSVNLNMPIGTPPPPLEEPVVITVDVDFDGTIYWNGEILAEQGGARRAPDCGRGDAGAARGPLAAEQAGRVQGRGDGDGGGAAARRHQARPGGQRAIRALARRRRRC